MDGDRVICIIHVELPTFIPPFCAFQTIKRRTASILKRIYLTRYTDTRFARIQMGGVCVFLRYDSAPTI